MVSDHRGLVAITGANGTIGYNSVLHALRTGYRVRCIVRREDAIGYIKAGPSLQLYADRIEYAIVPDNTIPGAYDEAVQGAKYVIHIAGVWPKPHYRPDEDVYYPFVRSMEEILSAAEKSDTVKRVVFTQAGAALVSTDDGDTLGTKMDKVLDVNPDAAAFQPPLPSVHHAYSGAKAYCMTYLHSHSRKSGAFSIVQVIPGTVIGPSELVSSASDALAQMDRMSKALLFNGATPRYGFGFVHVEDCARVHVEALDEEKVQGEDIPDWFIAAATMEEGKDGPRIWKEAGDTVEREFAEEMRNGVFIVGRENLPTNMPFRVDSRMTEEMLLGGRKFRSLEECVREVGQWYSGLVQNEKN
ncbi:NAD(P)-binding protein [Lindgomyces ingoldianus]|uniref:NAD(P)-binding protein n=1 Tax=Lindgomyces ingoldianus TaxID=673940 RepID=A0ACB6REN9_9PLEO|nr:NAD(P)-binding protein [Lindgomyces ingoldianus]KAF2477661.1 NAD(P)-binding protein [Lindgomyces ingoldianus]